MEHIGMAVVAVIGVLVTLRILMLRRGGRPNPHHGAPMSLPAPVVVRVARDDDGERGQR
jgi:hypothetical protein